MGWMLGAGAHSSCIACVTPQVLLVDYCVKMVADLDRPSVIWSGSLFYLVGPWGKALTIDVLC